MECEELQRELIAYIQGELSPSNQTAYDAHLANCQSCTQEAASLRQLSSTLKSGLKAWVDAGTCPDNLLEQIANTVHATPRRPWWQRWPGAVAVATAAAVFLGVGLVGIGPVSGGAPRVDALTPAVETRPEGLPVPADTRSVVIDRSMQVKGVTLRLTNLDLGTNAVRLQYRIEGEALDLFAEAGAYQVMIRTVGSTAAPSLMAVTNRDGLVTAEALYPKLQEEAGLTFVLQRVPQQRSAWERIWQSPWLEGPWEITLQP
jgi:predicted anti-sigma-YlaC factor YlaD